MVDCGNLYNVSQQPGVELCPSTLRAGLMSTTSLVASNCYLLVDSKSATSCIKRNREEEL